MNMLAGPKSKATNYSLYCLNSEAHYIISHSKVATRLG